MLFNAARRTARVSYLIAGILLIALAVFTVVARVGLPLLENYKGNIEARVSDYLQRPVNIGELSVRWEGVGPLLQARDVSIDGASDRTVSLDELLIDINFAETLLRGIPIINELSLIGASLAIEKDASGAFSIHGMQASVPTGGAIQPQESTQSESGLDLAAWLFNVRKVGLLDTRFTFFDDDLSQPIVVDHLNIRAENVGDVHQLRLDAQLPEELGGQIKAGIDLQGRAQDLASSDGNLYFQVQQMDTQGLFDLATSVGLTLNSAAMFSHLDAKASIELWGEWQDGRLVSARGPLTIESIKANSQEDIALDSLSANLDYSSANDESTLSASSISISKGSSKLLIDEVQHKVLPQTSAGETNDTVPNWQLKLSAQELALDMVTRVAALALESERPQLAAEFNAAKAGGFMRSLDMTITNSETGPVVDTSVLFEDLALDGQHLLPDIALVNGNLSISDSVGELELTSRDLNFSWAKLNDEQLVLDRVDLKANLNFQDLAKVRVDANAILQDNGVNTNSRAKLLFEQGASPHVDLQTGFTAGDINALKAWIPRKIMPTTASRWIDNAINAGVGSNGSILLFGHLADFPFNNGNGVFKARMDISEGALTFLPTWPQATGIEGSVELDGLTLSATATSAAVGRFTSKSAKANINNLAIPSLNFTATADGGLQNLLDFGTQGPLRAILQPALEGLSGQGDVQMDVSLGLSLYRKPAPERTDIFATNWKPFKVNGSVFLDNNTVYSAISNIEMAGASGAVNFDNRGIKINNIRTSILGHNVTLNAERQDVGRGASTMLNVSGAIEANDVLAHYANPLDQFIRGTSQWQIDLNVPHSLERIAKEGIELNVSSDLVGSELLLPKPFDKASSQRIPFSLTTVFNASPMQQWVAQYGDELRMRATLSDSSLSSLLIDLGQANAEHFASAVDAPGIRVQGTTDEFAADGWIRTVARYIDSLPSGDSASAPDPILPIHVGLSVDQLLLGLRSFGNASLRANSDDVYLNVAVTNQALQGNLRYPREYWSKETALKARVDTLDWRVIEALSDDAPNAGGARSQTANLDPSRLPPIEARVSLLRKNALQLKNLVLRASPNASGLDITTLGFAYDTMRMVGQGSWNSRDPQNVNPSLAGQQDTRLNLVLQSDDFGVGFEEIGLSGIIEDAEGTIELKLNWPGALYSPSVADLDGAVRIDLQSGSITQLEPGAGRVVGLFALQALPRRLNLDFKDLTGAGLAFKNITGSAVIENGMADIPLLQLTGPIGVVDIIGKSDLNTQQFDQKITVLPRVSAALPVIGAITGGASAGIGALVAAGILKALGVDFDRIGLRSYRLTGPWISPEFVPVKTDFGVQ